MLLAAHHECPPLEFYLPYRFGTQTTPPTFPYAAMGHDQQSHQQQQLAAGFSGPITSRDVQQALEIAREAPDGAKEPTIRNILETALSQIWGRVLLQPDSYTMSRDEFAVFNFFQHRFQGNAIAIAARRRYWEHLDLTTAS